MNEQLTLQQFLELASGARRVVVHRSLPMDRLTPINAYDALKGRGKTYLLESAVGDRHSFIGCRARVCVEARNREIYLEMEGERSCFEGDPIPLLRELHRRYRAVGASHLPPMIGGAIGFFSYDAVRYFEDVPDRHSREENFPDVSFTFFDAVVSFDHERSLLTLAISVSIGDSPEASYASAVEELDALLSALNVQVQLQRAKPSPQCFQVTADVDDVTFADLVKAAQEEIHAGEIFQVVLSRRFQCHYTVPTFDIYRAMRLINPAPFMFFLDQGDYAIAGASPERLVSLRRGRLETAPLAGTRPRGDGSRDQELEGDLLSDPKELAEHMMLVDLGRNDLGRISHPGTVSVCDVKRIVYHGPVMHISTRVVSDICDGFDGFDALRVSLPAGTVSGAPKIRAMEVIDEMEQSRRGLYGGAVGYLSANGDFDSCIAIRAAHLAHGRASVRTGAGIVADSIPEREAQETRHKAEGVLRAIALAQGGLP